MSDSVLRKSPIHHVLDALGAELRVVNRISIAWRLPADGRDDVAENTVGLCDLSGPPKFGLKGRAAAAWLAEQRIDVPAHVLESRDLPDGGVIARVGADEFLLESSINGTCVSALAEQFQGQDPDPVHLVRVERQEATFLLIGPRANDVMQQTCSVNFAEAPAQWIVWTRVAGVSCAVLPQPRDDRPCFRLWMDCSYAASFWESLTEICESLGGRVIGARAAFPDLLR